MNLVIHRIVEAFTRPHYQVTAIDELVQTATIIVPIFIFMLIAILITRIK